MGNEAQDGKERATIPRRLAAHLYASGNGGQYGASADVIARRLRRLLTQRRQRATASAELHRRLLRPTKEAMGEDLSATLLSPASVDNK